MSDLYTMVYFSEGNMSCIVHTALGSLQGKRCVSCNGKEYYSFEGIPYAKPPVGVLRFRDPQPPESWSGIRDATKPGHKCAQMDPYGKTSLIGSEDCLYLNVYTPSLPSEKLEKLPVLFFVHGGRFLVGHGDYYKPDYFLENDVILVTINYRLHILGFLCLHTEDVPGNAALKDTIMALKWVKINIGQFNGDAGNIIAYGESAGAGLVSSYLTSKIADGLVNKIIAQSGVCLSDLYLIDENPIEKAKKIASILGQEFGDINELYTFLSKAPIEDLIFASGMAELSRPAFIINAYFLPVIEKKFEGIQPFFEEYPVVTVKKNQHKKIPVLVGLNSYEGALFLRKDSEGNIDYLKDFQRFIPRYLCLKYNSPESEKFGRKLKEFYFKNKEVGNETKEQYLDFVSDAYFNRDIVMFAEIFSKENENLFLYYFSYDGNMNTRILKNLGVKGAAHGDIIPYQFYRKNKAEKCTETDKKVIRNITEAWCNFARNGKPSWSNSSLTWVPYERNSRHSMNIATNSEISVGPLPIWGRIDFWLRNTGERSKL